MYRLAAFLILLAAIVATGAPGRAEGLLSAKDKEIYQRAFRDAARSRWAQAKRVAKLAEVKIPLKVIRWLEMTRRGANVSFAEYTSFLEQNPDWPNQERLRQRAEESIRFSTPSEQVLAWFSKHAPITTQGRVMLGRALIGAGLRDEAIQMLREAWVQGSFNRSQERDFLARYGRYLTDSHHLSRLDHLLWEGRRHEAQRMVPRVPKEYRALNLARIRLRRGRKNVDEALRHVPQDQASHAGLLYERLRWHRRRGQVDKALTILESPPDDLVRPELWWREREIVLRRVLERGEAERAYLVAKDHRLEYGTEYAAGEWMAGWIALSFLERPAVALSHFQRVYEVVSYPISLARGAYWAGRAEEAMGNAFGAREWYRKAAEFDLTYYGQLAAARIETGKAPAGPNVEPQPSADQVATFNAHELVRVVLLLDELGQAQYMRPFFERMVEVLDQPEWRVLAGRLALALDRRNLAVRIGRKAYRRGDPLTSVGYPVIDLPIEEPEQALLLSVARQESNFKVSAMSRSGARGLMQLMPATARAMARRIGEKYSRGRLTKDPVYNLKLGSAYLRWLLGKYDGSYILAVAGYNAGPAAVDRWTRELGDPRKRQISPVDWVEIIPYDETRNYVQRVLESLSVYRQRLEKSQIAYSLQQDLAR